MTDVPYEIFLALPYLVILLALVFLVVKGFERGSLASKPQQCVWLIHQLVTHHFHGHDFAVRQSQRFVDDAHPTTSYAAVDPVAVNVFSSETVVGCLAQTIRNHLGHQHL